MKSDEADLVISALRIAGDNAVDINRRRLALSAAIYLIHEHVKPGQAMCYMDDMKLAVADFLRTARVGADRILCDLYRSLQELWQRLSSTNGNRNSLERLMLWGASGWTSVSVFESQGIMNWVTVPPKPVVLQEAAEVVAAAD